MGAEEEHRIRRLWLVETRYSEFSLGHLHSYENSRTNLLSKKMRAHKKKKWKASKTHRHIAYGVERADSFAVDLHKWMYMPYGIGCTLVRDRLAHYSTFVYGHDAQYLKAGTDLVKSGEEKGRVSAHRGCAAIR